MVEIWNWARTFSCRPRLYVEPKSLESLHSLIQQIDAKRWKVRLIGCGHSPSSLALSDEVLISMKHFDQIIEMNVEEKFLHCQAGVLISTLNEILPSHQLSLPVQGSISALTIGGAISTGTHGSGLDFGTLSSYLRFVRLMKLNGEIVECHRDDPTQSDLFRSLSCSLGAFGIILDVQIDLSPLFYLELHQHRLSFSSFVDHLPVHVAASDHFRYMWFPHTHGGIAYHLKRVPPSTPITQFNLFQRVFSSLRHRIIGYHFLEILFYVSLWFPRFVRWINRLYLRWEGGSRRQVSRCDHLFNFDCLFRQYANEWSVPLDEAVACLVDLEAAMETNHHVHFPIEIRFGRAEWTSFLSPSFGRSTCWINTVAYRPFGREHSEHRAFFREFERICLSHGGRPHWAKEHPLTSRQLAELYPQWTVFHQHRRRFDPNDLLINSCLKKMFLDE